MSVDIQQPSSSAPRKKTQQKPKLHKPIDGQLLKTLVEASLTWLRTNQQIVNSLNVFPVPDGDTGTNMVLTMQAAYNEIASSTENNFGIIAHAVAHGALMGARGNSGVILSQLWRGFARVVDNYPALEMGTFIQALNSARDTAYKGVVRPVEGTILTVAKDIAARAEAVALKTNNMSELLEIIVEEANQSVLRTPSLLPVLKEAGVVDSGGKGLFFILEGMLNFIKGIPLDVTTNQVVALSEITAGHTLSGIEPGQDFEVVVDFKPNGFFDLNSFYNELEEMGTSIQVGEGDGIYRMHIHVPTDNLYRPIDYTRTIGTVTKVAIENLIDQLESNEPGCDNKVSVAEIEPNQNAVIAVSPGYGIGRVFASLGAAAIVEGGQTMNPSTEEIIRAFENLPTDKIIILPNNKNIVLTAKAAADLTGKKVAVIPSVSVPQGLAAMMRLTPDGDFDSTVKDMSEALSEVQTGEITCATRSVEIDGVEVKEGQNIALLNGKLVCAASKLDEVCLEFLQKAQAANSELITLFYGSNITKAEVSRISDLIRDHYPGQVVEVQEGCQPHYQFIISIE